MYIKMDSLNHRGYLDAGEDDHDDYRRSEQEDRVREKIIKRGFSW